MGSVAIWVICAASAAWRGDVAWNGWLDRSGWVACADILGRRLSLGFGRVFDDGPDHGSETWRGLRRTKSGHSRLAKRVMVLLW